MAKIGSGSIKIEFDNSGGSLVDMSAYILDMGELAVQALFEEITAFGVTSKTQSPVGQTEVPDCQLDFLYDDTATVVKTGTGALTLGLLEGPTGKFAGTFQLDQGALVRLFDRAVPSPHAHYLCWRTGAMDRWEVAAFAEWLKKAVT